MTWKKVSEWKDYHPAESWRNEKGNSMAIWRTAISYKEMSRRGKKGRFIVSIQGKKRYFKTKKQAFKYAKSYMKTH